MSTPITDRRVHAAGGTPATLLAKCQIGEPRRPSPVRGPAPAAHGMLRPLVVRTRRRLLLVSAIVRAAQAACLLLGMSCAAIRPGPATGPVPTSHTVITYLADNLGPDGRLLVREAPPWGDHRTHLAVVDVERKAVLGTFDHHEPWPPRDFTPITKAIAFTPDAAVVASLAGRPHQVLLWNPRTQQLLARVTLTEPVIAFGFSPDGRELLLATPIRLERRAVPDGRPLGEWKIPGVRTFAFLPDGALLIAIETRERALLAVLRAGHPRPRRLRIDAGRDIEGMRVSPNGRWLALTAWGHHSSETLQVWDLHTRRPLPIHSDEVVRSFAFSDDSRLFVASLGAHCVEPRIRHTIVWATEDARIMTGFSGSATAIRVTGHEVSAVAGDGVTRVDLDTGVMVRVLPPSCEPNCSVLCG